MSKDTEILTDDGWKTHDTIDTKKHKVATLENGILKYELAIAQTSFHYRGKMYYKKTNSLDMLVTPNHKLYVAEVAEVADVAQREDKFHLVEAQHIKQFNSVRHKKNVINCNEDYLFCLPITSKEDKLVISPDQMDVWCTLFGLYISIGWVSVDENNESTRINLPQVFFTSHSPYIAKLHTALIALQSDFVCRKSEEFCQITNRQLCKYFKKLKSLRQRTLPDWVWKMSSKQAQIMIQAMSIGDGYRHNESEFYTSSLQLRNDFQRLCLHAGWACDYYDTPGTFDRDTPLGRRNLWRCHILIHEDELHTPLTLANSVTFDREEWVDYDDTVWCVEVPSHVFYMRRNGRTCWTGNSSRHGQKGTCGMTFREEDMPFTKDGMTPDIIMNPHAIPSRMTIGHMIECLASKESVLSGNQSSSVPFSTANSTQDSTSFKTVDEIASNLEKLGYDPYGLETLYNPLNGRKMLAKIFIGPTFYQKLRHMVRDKCHARSFGKNEILTRQPVEGRARDGGFRFGEMERDAVLAHGATALLLDRLRDNSDPFHIPICGTCGLIAYNKLGESGDSLLICNRCKQSGVKFRVQMVASSYCFKLLLHELQSMNISLRCQL